MASNKSSKAAVSLSLNDILSDIEAFPAAPTAHTEKPHGSTLLHSDDRAQLPESSDSPTASIDISQRFINNSKKVLKNTDELDAVKIRLDNVDRLLGEVEQSVRS